MNDINPYAAQQSSESDQILPADSPLGTSMPRHISAILDNIFAMVLAVIAAQQISDSLPLVQIAAMVLVFLGYFFVFEVLFSATPGKFVNGLVVRDYEGGRCTIRQAAVRTVFRVIEVNPFFFGGLPAAARIVWTRDKQRFGDKLAGTVVVFRNES